MTIAELVDQSAATSLGVPMLDLMCDLEPICRSITGEGVRQTLRRVAQEIPLSLHEVPTGTQVYDWTVPREWNVHDAFVADQLGHRIIDFRTSPLHLVSYSTPISARLSLADLKPHLHSLPEQPYWVPYRTTYYEEDWGFCLSQRQLDTLDEGPYDVHIDATLVPGSLTYGECVLPGRLREEVLVSTHVCHPAMANDNLSGIAVAAALARLLSETPRTYTYRFVFVPGTIGCLSWLAEHEAILPDILHGLVLTGLGGPGELVWKETRNGTRAIDAAARHVVTRRRGSVRGFSPWGYDERQYNSPGFDLPVGRLTRTPHGEYPEYHTSADNMALMSQEGLSEALQALLEIVDVLENDVLPMSLNQRGEPQLGRRGLYPSVGGRSADEAALAMLWTMSLADGNHSLLDISERAGSRFAAIRRTAALLAQHDLLDLHG